MIDFLVAKLHDVHFITMMMAAIAVSATAYTLIMPFFAGESLDKRMKAVANERERIRARERDRLSKSEKVSLRQTPKQLVSEVVEDFNLSKWLAQENRDMRMNEAEKKAAALPPKLTVPMILLFLPVLFVVILGPTGIKVASMQ